MKLLPPIAAGVLLVTLSLALTGCNWFVQEPVRIANVYVSYETRGDAQVQGEQVLDRKVKRLDIYPDYFHMYFDESTGKHVAIDKHLMRFEWSLQPSK